MQPDNLPHQIKTTQLNTVTHFVMSFIFLSATVVFPFFSYSPHFIRLGFLCAGLWGVYSSFIGNRDHTVAASLILTALANTLLVFAFSNISSWLLIGQAVFAITLLYSAAVKQDDALVFTNSLINLITLWFNPIMTSLGILSFLPPLIAYGYKLIDSGCALMSTANNNLLKGEAEIKNHYQKRLNQKSAHTRTWISSHGAYRYPTASQFDHGFEEISTRSFVPIRSTNQPGSYLSKLPEISNWGGLGSIGHAHDTTINTSGLFGGGTLGKWNSVF